MKSAAAHKLPIVVLDRPDPIGGEAVEGNVLDPRFASFVGPAPIAMRYGLTIGELAQLFNAELGVGAVLTVIRLEGWQRAMWYDQTGLAWVNPSPNMRSLSAAVVYPGTVLFEGTNLSEGRGTDTPFEWIGAPWMNADAWEARLNAADLPGVHFAAAERTPTESKFAGDACHGVAIETADRDKLQPMALGVAMLVAARHVAGAKLQFTADAFDSLAGTDEVRNAIDSGRPADEIVASWQAERERFKAIRQPYLLY
jgi:uncharacterized protein YbbC (DUF1343 family)